MKKNQGVTLIALVVTIIVLLILAVVSFRIITGDDGVMSKAEVSASETERAKAREQAELWIAEQVANYYEEGHSGTLVAYISGKIGTDGARVGNYTITKATGESAKVESVAKVATLEGAYATEAPQTLEIEVHKGDKTGEKMAAGTVGATGKVAWTSSTSGSGSGSGSGTGGGTTVKNYTVSFYKENGDTTAYATKTVSEGGTIGENMPEDPTKDADSSYIYTFSGWKIEENSFDGDTTINSDTSVYADWTAAVNPTAGFGTVNSEYSAYFGKLTDYSANQGSNWRLFYADSNYAYLLSDSIGNKALNDSTFFPDFSSATMSTLGKNLNKQCSIWFWRFNKDNDSVKGIAGLLDTSKWGDFANDSKGAVWAIGAPTLEMFVESYNATHLVGVDCVISHDSDWGYRVKKGNGGWNTYISGLEYSADIDRAMYLTDDIGWWLASPSKGSPTYLMGMILYESGYLTMMDYCDAHGIRPLVAVPLSYVGTIGQEKAITISNNYFNN